MIDTPKQIIDALVDAGETQSSIYRATGVSQATISRIQAGVAKDPRSSTVNRLKEFAMAKLSSATADNDAE